LANLSGELQLFHFGTIMVLIVFPELADMATITLKNIPDDLYKQLKDTAKAHHRSINSELINCLEIVLKPKKVPIEQRLARLRSVRVQVRPDTVAHKKIRQAIEEGRP
jgi:plasmid stability protein